MNKYQIYSTRGEDIFGVIFGDSESEAVDRFARMQGYEDRSAMWDAGVRPDVWARPHA